MMRAASPAQGVRYDVVYEYAAQHKLSYNELCQVVRAALSTPSPADPSESKLDKTVTNARTLLAQAIDMIEQKDLCKWSDAHDRVTLAALREVQSIWHVTAAPETGIAGKPAFSVERGAATVRAAAAGVEDRCGTTHPDGWVCRLPKGSRCPHCSAGVEGRKP